MIQTISLVGRTGPYRSALPRAELNVDNAIETVAPICKAVALEGEAALKRFSKQFDSVVPPTTRVRADVIEQCARNLDPTLKAAFEESINRRRQVAETLETEPREQTLDLAPGARVGSRLIPVNRVGLYVPGGLAPLASSVIMNVIPAKVAGVGSIAVASPPQKDFGGWPHPNILALCHMLGVDEVFAVGGAQAIAMFAHGVDQVCEKADLVTGPGNIWVVAAKRYLRGLIGIDSEAGPTEVAILADASAKPDFVAADLISQAEHDPQAASVLVTDSAELADAVRAELASQVVPMLHRERIVTALSGPQSAIVLVDDIDQGIDVVNAYAAEHLEIQTRDAADVAARIQNAGAIFVGDYSPVSLGDYSAGSTHVLPTGGCACHSSGLNVRSFMRAVHVIDYTSQGLAAIAEGIETFANAERLPGHAAAIALRRS